MASKRVGRDGTERKKEKKNIKIPHIIWHPRLDLRPENELDSNIQKT